MRTLFILSIFFTELSLGSEERTLVPGIRIGPVSNKSSEAELIKRLGAKQVKSSTSYLAGSTEGEEGPVTILFPDDVKKEIIVVWKDSSLKNNPELAYTSGSHWLTEDGLSIGVTLEKLEEINGRSFKFMPFNSDVAGNIIDWMGGKLSNWAKTGSFVTLRNTNGDDSATKEHLSSDIAARKLKPVVSQIRIKF